MKLRIVPVLPGWVTLAEAAEAIGVSRQHCWRMADKGKWKSLRVIGESNVYVVSTEEVAKERRLRGRDSEDHDSARRS
jgi:predicted DNA-binding protein (UPF0251 family)